MRDKLKMEEEKLAARPPRGLVPKPPSDEKKLMDLKEARQNKFKKNRDEEKLKLLGFCFIGTSQLTCWHRPTH